MIGVIVPTLASEYRKHCELNRTPQFNEVLPFSFGMVQKYKLNPRGSVLQYLCCIVAVLDFVPFLMLLNASTTSDAVKFWRDLCSDPYRTRVEEELIRDTYLYTLAAFQ